VSAVPKYYSVIGYHETGNLQVIALLFRSDNDRNTVFIVIVLFTF